MQFVSEPAMVHIMTHHTQGPASAVIPSVCPQFMTLLSSQEVLFGTTHCGFQGVDQSPWWDRAVTVVVNAQGRAQPSALPPTASAEGAGKPLLQARLSLHPALNF